METASGGLWSRLDMAEETVFELEDTVKLQVAQSCPTLCDPMDCTFHGVLQTGIRQWVAVPFSRGFSQPSIRTQVACIAGRFFTSLNHRGSPKDIAKESLETEKQRK